MEIPVIKTNTDRSPWSLPHLNCLKFVYLKFYICTLLHIITSLNPLKSVCIIYQPKYYKLFCPSVNISSEPLRFVNETKYLGFTFCNRNKDDKDIIRQMRSVYARSNSILRTFSHCSIGVKFVLFNSYCTTLYCSYLWTEYKKTSFNKIRIALNNAYRRIFGLSNRSTASAMYANYNICNF